MTGAELLKALLEVIGDTTDRSRPVTLADLLAAKAKLEAPAPAAPAA